MPLTKEQQEYQRKYREKNRKKRNEYMKEYREQNKEQQQEYDRKYYEKNNEKIKERRREYIKKNKEKVRKYNNEYRQTPSGIKTYRISQWKKRGIICDDYDKVYDIYVKETNCWWCNKEFENSYDRCLDHDHDHDINDRENIRGIICKGCNNRDVYKIF